LQRYDNESSKISDFIRKKALISPKANPFHPKNLIENPQGTAPKAALYTPEAHRSKHNELSLAPVEGDDWISA